MGFGQRPVFMTDGSRNALRSKNALEGDQYQGFRVWTLSELLFEVRRLTPEEKIRRTLSNLSFLEGEPGFGLYLGVQLKPYPGKILPPTSECNSLYGPAYGCTHSEAMMVFALLLKRGWLVISENSKVGARVGDGQEMPEQWVRVHLTPEGYEQVHLRVPDLDSEAPTAFLVCRFNDEMEKVYEQVYSKVGLHQDVNCPIYRVKDVHHVDRIDDRIVHELNKATVTIVDLTEENFNVAFEAGYALALNKPIVWTKRKSGGQEKIPFDIQSQNILFWDENDLEDFADKLKFRLLAALEKESRRKQV